MAESKLSTSGQLKRRPFSFGPAILVTAAFIGPGTVMAASSAGAKFGFVLLWAVAFSILATIVLQETAGRLGIVTGNGLSHSIKSTISNPIARFLILGLVLVAIFVGNAAYQTGNILGAANGVLTINEDVVTPSDSEKKTEKAATVGQPNEDSKKDPNQPWLNQNTIVVFIGLVAMVVIWVGRFDILQLILTLLVAIMSLLFVIAALKSNPDWSLVLGGFMPRVPDNSELIVIGLIGTTVVPYNLFLHSSAAAQRWGNHESSDNERTNDELRTAIVSSRWDTIISVLIGGLVTCAILITASVAFHSQNGASAELKNVKDVAVQLAPALGPWAKTLFAIGLFAAGLTSAITAPIAAGYAASGCFGWTGKLSDWRVKLTASIVVIAGAVFGILYGSSPKETIILAQAANGLLLPIVAILLLVMANRSDLMLTFKNGWFINILAVLVISITALIAYKNFNYVSKEIHKLQNPAVQEPQQPAAMK